MLIHKLWDWLLKQNKTTQKLTIVQHIPLFVVRDGQRQWNNRQDNAKKFHFDLKKIERFHFGYLFRRWSGNIHIHSWQFQKIQNKEHVCFSVWCNLLFMFISIYSNSLFRQHQCFLWGREWLIKRQTHNQGEKTLYTNLCSGISSSIFKITSMVSDQIAHMCSVTIALAVVCSQTHGTVLRRFMLKLNKNYLKNILGWFSIAWDFQQCGMYDQQSLCSACAYAQSDQSLC